MPQAMGNLSCQYMARCGLVSDETEGLSMDDKSERMAKARALEEKYHFYAKDEAEAEAIKQEMRELLTPEEFEDFFPYERLARMLGAEWMEKVFMKRRN